MATLTPAENIFLEQVARGKRDHDWFCTNILRIEYLEPGRTRLIPLILNPPQRTVLESIEAHGTTFVLKARRLGITTDVLALFYRRILFSKGYKTATLAHTDEAAENIRKIMSVFYANMPDAWKMMFPLVTDSSDMLTFKNGGSYRVGSARSQGFRGSGLNILHLSEFSQYPHIDMTLEAVAATLPPGARTIWETTSNGLNLAYDKWMGDESKDGIHRIFFPWTDEPRYARPDPPPSIPKEMAEYLKDYPFLTDEQFFWACWEYLTHYNGNLAGFNREYPITAQVAFVVSGSRVWPHVVFPDALRTFFVGPNEIEAPIAYHLYSAGSDQASGGPTGDYSALSITDCTDKANPKTVYTFYDRITTPEYAKIVYDTCMRYKAVLAVERQFQGQEIINRLQDMGYPYLYTKETVAHIGAPWTKTVGFDTSSTGRPHLIGLLHQFIGSRIMQVTDPRLQLEINHFEHCPHGARGELREEARAGTHDDLLIATALSLEAMSQTHRVEREINQIRPVTVEDLVRYKKATGKKYDPRDPKFAPDPLREALDGSGRSGMRSTLGNR
jgi:hypothetical protein